jgi:hypothetical protein
MNRSIFFCEFQQRKCIKYEDIWTTFDPGTGPLKMAIFDQKRCILQTILRRLQTSVGPALLQEKTFDIVSGDENMLFADLKSVHRKSWAIEVSWSA